LKEDTRVGHNSDYFFRPKKCDIQYYTIKSLFSKAQALMTLPFRYGIYGICLRSEFPLALPDCAAPPLAEIALHRVEPARFRDSVGSAELIERDDWYHYAHLEDGSSYVRWRGVGEFLVSRGGTEISCLRAMGATDESFQVYLLGQALSFALVKAGLEPLHATAIVHKGEAIALLGDSGFGKSTLAAGFMSAGDVLLTDDLLLVRPEAGELIAYPGPARIKLFPDSARRFLGTVMQGVKLNAMTNKQVIMLDAVQRCSHPVKLRAVYALAPPREMRLQRKVRIAPMSSREAFFTLVANTFNRYIVDPARLRRQLVKMTLISQAISVRTLAYPRSAARLAEVREAIITDCPVAETTAA
jgi:hypothetical protein